MVQKQTYKLQFRENKQLQDFIIIRNETEVCIYVFMRC